MSTDADALSLLDEIAESLLRLQPESATSLGIDTGARAALRSQLGDRSATGRQRLATQVRGDMDRGCVPHVVRRPPGARSPAIVILRESTDCARRVSDGRSDLAEDVDGQSSKRH